MAEISQSYDHPNYTTIRQHQAASAVASGSNPALGFRSQVACVVTQITAILGGSLVGSATVILTLLFNNSVAAILTLEESINEEIGTFTMSANRTLSSFTDGYRIMANAALTGDTQVHVEYQYRIVPGATFSLAAALT